MTPRIHIPRTLSQTHSSQPSPLPQSQPQQNFQPHLHCLHRQSRKLARPTSLLRNFRIGFGIDEEPENLRVDVVGRIVSLIAEHLIKKDKELELAVIKMDRMGTKLGAEAIVARCEEGLALGDEEIKFIVKHVIEEIEILNKLSNQSKSGLQNRHNELQNEINGLKQFIKDNDQQQRDQIPKIDQKLYKELQFLTQEQKQLEGKIPKIYEHLAESDAKYREEISGGMEKISKKIGTEIENMSAEINKIQKEMRVQLQELMEQKNRQIMDEVLGICGKTRKRAKGMEKISEKSASRSKSQQKMEQQQYKPSRSKKLESLIKPLNDSKRQSDDELQEHEEKSYKLKNKGRSNQQKNKQ